MKKTVAIAFVAFTGLLTACNPFVAELPANNPDELCLQDGFTPCTPDPNVALSD